MTTDGADLADRCASVYAQSEGLVRCSLTHEHDGQHRHYLHGGYLAWENDEVSAKES